MIRNLRSIVWAAAAATALLAGCASSISLDEPLEGPTWRLVRLGAEPVTATGTDGGEGPNVHFERSAGRISGSGGCNRLAGTYRQDGRGNAGSLRIGPLASTRMACADPARTALETRFNAALEAAASYRTRQMELTLLDRGGQPLAVFDSGLR